VRRKTINNKAARRLLFDYYLRYRNAYKTRCYFGISAQTFYGWKRWFDPHDLMTLEETSRRHYHVRKAETMAVVTERNHQLRKQYTCWGAGGSIEEGRD